MLYSSCATLDIMTEVLFVMFASSVVISIFSPFTSSSMPNSSTKAPRVPEPSSLDTTVMSLVLSQSPDVSFEPLSAVPLSDSVPDAASVLFPASSFPPHAASPNTITPASITAANLFIVLISFFLELSNDLSLLRISVYRGKVKYKILILLNVSKVK